MGFKKYLQRKLLASLGYNKAVLWFVEEFQDYLNEWICDHSVGLCNCKARRELQGIVDKCDDLTRHKIGKILGDRILDNENA